MSLDPSYAPQETPAELWNEITHFVGETTLCGFSYGILTTLYILTLDALLPQLRNPANRSYAIFHIIYTTIILILIGAGTASDARLAQRYWINNRNYPGGTSEMINTVHFPELVWGWAVYIVNSWLQDGYVIYRCLVFWNWNLWICGLPILAFLGSIGTSIALLVEINTQGIFGQFTIDFAICWYVFSVSINVLATLFIVGRLLYKRRAINAILGSEFSKTYTGVVTMFVESAAVYSIVGLVFIGTYFRRSPAGNVVLPFLGNLGGICPIMIIYRIAIGRGWTHKALRQVDTMDTSTLQPNSIGSKKLNYSSWGASGFEDSPTLL